MRSRIDRKTGRVIDVVIPTIGRESLAALLASIAAATGPRPRHIILVDDRAGQAPPLTMGAHDADFLRRICVIRGRAAGPASARNIGWRFSRAEWIAFLDDDVLVHEDWLEALRADLSNLPIDVAGSTGRVTVPLPATRKPTDWERNVGSLAAAQWITADCAYRRTELLAAGGFDERFRRAYREDADLALRIVARGQRIVTGTRGVDHPVRAAAWTISISLQAGNADDVLMEALHGSDWYEAANAPRGAFRSHIATVAYAGFALLGASLWSAATARFAWRRIAPGPRDRAEIAKMVATSVVIPFVAVYERLRGYARRGALLRDRKRAPQPVAPAVLFDRDGTLIVDVAFNANPSEVHAMPGARDALDRLRDAGIKTAVVSNQSGIALGYFDAAAVDAVNARVESLLGPLGPIFVCPHAVSDACACRKPAPGMIQAAARALAVRPSDCVVIGDIGADIEAATAAGARSILVATASTRSEEIVAAPRTATSLEAAVTAVLAGLA